MSKRSYYEYDLEQDSPPLQNNRKRIQHPPEHSAMPFKRTRYTRGRGRRTRHTKRRGSYTKRQADYILLGKRVATKLIAMARGSASKYIAYSQAAAGSLAGYRNAIIPSNPASSGQLAPLVTGGLELVSYNCVRLNSSGVNNDSVQQRSGDVIHVSGIHGTCKWYIPASVVSNVHLILDLVYIKAAENAVSSGIKATYTGSVPSNLTISHYDAGAQVITLKRYGVANPPLDQMEDYLNGNTSSACGVTLLKRWRKQVVPAVSTDYYDVVFPINMKFKKPLKFDFSNTAYQESDTGMLWLIARSDCDPFCNLQFEMKVYFQDQS